MVNCASDESLATTETQASDKNHILDALNMAASSIRTELGESLSMVQKFATPVEQATTPSLDALHAFSLGVKTKDITGDEAAVPLFEEAIKLDPSDAEAYVSRGAVQEELGNETAARADYQKALDIVPDHDEAKEALARLGN